MFEWLSLTWTTTSGITVRVATYNEWIIYNEIFVDGEYDPAIHAALGRVSGDRPFRVLDLGANVGFFTLRLFDRLRGSGRRDAACDVTLVEADAALVPVLDARLHHDNALAGSVRVVHGAVGRRDGTATFYPSAASPGNGSLEPRPGRGGVTVPSVDVDRVTRDMPDIDLVKCDIEGAELSFFELYPALLRKTATLIVEIHADRSPIARCRELLGAAGLTRERVLRDRGGCALHLYTRE
jgi:FkbM family methyltransferase